MVSFMEAESMIQSAEMVIQQITDNPEEILAVLKPGERANLIEEVGSFSSRAAVLSTWSELVEIADSICRMVEDHPALRPLFFEAQFDVNKAQLSRKISLADHQAITGADQYRQARAIQVKNSILDCRDQLQKALGEFETQAQKTVNNKDE
jgi:hypothetical protein